MTSMKTNLTNPKMNASSDYVWQGPDYNRQLRLIVLAVLYIFSLTGNTAVFMWMWLHRRAKNRIHTFMVHLCTADLLVAFFALLSHFIVELLDLTWLIGDVGCRVYKILQCCTFFASSNMVVAIGADRYHSVVYPFRQRLDVYSLIIPAWIVAFLLSIPQAFVWHQVVDEHNVVGCHSSLQKPWQKQSYLTWVALINFFLPFIIITTCYVRIVVHLLQKRNTVLPGKGERRRRAKMKTLRMTCVIISVFVLCGLPYFALDMYRFYSDSDDIEPNAYAVLGIFAVSHCAVNPFIFLSFNARATPTVLKYQESSFLTSAHTRTLI
ncbi:vasopressin V1b receptor-like [Glandiceps talaboti]